MWHHGAQFFFSDASQHYFIIYLFNFQEMSGKHHENLEIYFLRLVLSRKFTFSDWFYFPEISLSDRLWSGERITGHGNFLNIFLQCVLTYIPFSSPLIPVLDLEVIVQQVASGPTKENVHPCFVM